MAQPEVYIQYPPSVLDNPSLSMSVMNLSTVATNASQLMEIDGPKSTVIKIDNVPPSYKPNERDAPTEETLLTKLEEQYGPRGFIGFVKTAVVLFVGSVGCLMMVMFCVVIPPAMVTIGGLYMDDCPAQPYIPLFLVVGGSFALGSVALGTAVRIRLPNKDTPHTKRVDMLLLAVSNLVHCFTIAWFIAGCTWVYGAFEPSYENVGIAPYCDKTVYLFSFYLLNGIFIIMGFILMLGLFMLLTSLCIGGSKEQW